MAQEMNFFTEAEQAELEKARAGDVVKEEKVMWSADGQTAHTARKRKKNVGMIIAAAVIIASIVGILAAVFAGKGKEPPKASLPASTEMPAPIETPEPTPEPTPTPRPGPDVKADDWFAMRTGADLPIPEEYHMTDTMVDPGGYWLDERIAEDYLAMIHAAEEDGMQLKIISGYRGEEVQQNRYDTKVRELVGAGMDRETAQQEALKTVLPGGYSEHNLGLAADLVSRSRQAKEVFTETPEYSWLKEHAAEYGFIERYPAGREDVTGMEAKPWHWRYVGKELAQFLTSEGLTLDEYHSQYLSE